MTRVDDWNAPSAMESKTYSVGEMARASGLTVSALRFYANRNVLVPAHVDPRTGYRWYASEQVAQARLLQILRSADVPLAELKRIVSESCEGELADQIFDAHLVRLERKLEGARIAFVRARALLADTQTGSIEPPTRLSVAGAELASALTAIRFAVAAAGETPALRAILVEVRDEVMTLVATDRHRMAIGRAPVSEVTGPPASVLVDADPFERSVRALTAERAVSVLVDGTGLAFRGSGREISSTGITDRFPDYRKLLPESARHRVSADRAALRRDLAAAPARRVVRERDGQMRDVSVLAFRGERLSVVDPQESGQRLGLRIGVDRRYLLEAVEALGCDQMVLAVNGPTAPMTLRPAYHEHTLSVLMPVRL